MMQKGAKKKKRRMRRDAGSYVVRLLVMLFFLALVAVGASMYINQNQMMVRVNERTETLDMRYEAVLQEYQTAKELEQKIGTDDFIEQMARSELGMVRPKEIIFERND